MPPARLDGGCITEEAIHRLVAHFYDRARRDELLGPVFARVIGQSDATWVAHLAGLSDFWSSVMLTSGRYHGDPFSAHLHLPAMEPAMFDQWLALFGETCAELFDPDVAGAFRERADRIARSLRMGLFERLPARGRAIRPEATRAWSRWSPGNCIKRKYMDGVEVSGGLPYEATSLGPVYFVVRLSDDRSSRRHCRSGSSSSAKG